jgi:hypothetical protein
MATIIVPKSSKRFRCEICDFDSSRKSQYDRHTLTTKHKMATNATVGQHEKDTKVAISKTYKCACGKEYLHHCSIWKHRKNCSFEKEKGNEKEKENNTDIEIIKEKQQPTLFVPDSPNIVMELLKQNSEFKELIKEQSYHMMENNKSILEQNKNMCELISKVGVGSTTTNHTNSHNTTNKNRFNINLFLNEQCKDAMNIMDFVNSLQLQLSDLEKVGEIGFVKGISNILVKNLKELDVCKRPIHCSDLKRETLYVKDENTWEKENGKNEKLTKMIQHVAHKNVKQIPEWQKEHPDFKDSESIESEKYLKIVGESMGGTTEDDDIDNYNKIIKTLAKEVTIEKENE